MHHHRLIAGLAAATVVLAAPAAWAQSDYRQLAIGITPVRGDDPTVCDAIYNEFRNRIIALNRFTVIERDDARMRDVIKEGAFAASGLVAESSGPRLGQLLGAGYLSFLEYDRLAIRYTPPEYDKKEKKTKPGKYEASLNANVRFVNTETGVAMKAFTASGSGTDPSRSVAISNAVSSLVSEMLLATRELFALKASITKRDGRTVLVNLGSQHGLKEGTHFTVNRDWDGITKPVGQLVITAVGQSKSEARIRDGYWQVREGDAIVEDPRAGGSFGLALTYEYVPVNAPASPQAGSGFAASASPAHLIGAQLNFPELFGESAGLKFGGGYLATGGKGLQGTVFDLLGNYRFDLVPEVFALELSAGPSLMHSWQDKTNYLGTDGGFGAVTESSLSNWSFGGTAGLNAIVHLNRTFQLTGGVGYRFLSTITSWDGSTGKDTDSFTTSEMAYPSFGVGGLVFRGGLQATF